jgi:hypothetical protein
MAKLMEDGSLLIQGSEDGFFVPLLEAKKVKGVRPDPTLMHHMLEHGRPATIDHAARQEKIKALIKEMRTWNPKLTFAEAWLVLQQKRPELFAG